MATSICNFNHLLPDGVEPFDYQQVGVAYALVTTLDGKGMFFADEQGLGKTWESIITVLAKYQRRTPKVLVIAKSSIKYNWLKEISKLAPAWDVNVLRGTQPYEITGNVAIINFDLLAAWADALVEEGFDAVIIDESHHVKSMGTPKKPVQRTVAALKICQDVRSRKGLVLLLSGTPILNRPIELMPQLEMIGRLEDVTPKPRGGDSLAAWRKAFKNFYCWNDERGDYTGARNTNILNTRMRSFGYARRIRSEVLSLDDTHRIQVPLSLNGELAKYFAIEENFVPTRPESAKLELMTALRQAAGMAKIPAAIEWVEDFVAENPGKKLVAWGWHVPVQKELAAALNAKGIKAIYWGGARNPQETESLKTEFNSGEAQVIVCSLQAHGFGHTLVGDGNNVTDCLFVEQPWHPGAVSQAEDRINRIGREAAAVFAHTLVCPDTIDQWLADLIDEKWMTFKATAEGTIPAGEEGQIQNLVMAKLVAYMKAKYNIDLEGKG